MTSPATPTAVLANDGWSVFGDSPDIPAALSASGDLVGAQCDTANGTLTVQIGALPAGAKHCVFRLRILESGQSGVFLARLLSGTTVVTIAPTPWTLTDTWTDHTLDLTASENTAVDDADVRLELTANYA